MRTCIFPDGADSVKCNGDLREVKDCKTELCPL